MLSRIRSWSGAIAVLIIPFATACNGNIVDPSSSKSVYAIGQNSRAVPSWGARPINGFVGCLNHDFQSSSYLMAHIVPHTKTNADGSVITTERLNTAGGKLFDGQGGEYILQETGDYSQELELSGAYQTSNSTAFRLISKGGAVNEFVDLIFKIVWNNSTFQFDLDIRLACRGNGG